MIITKSKFIFAVMATVVVAMTVLPWRSASGRIRSEQPPETTQTTGAAYVGQFSLSPAQGPAGTVATGIGRNFDPNTKLQIVWQGFQGSWKVNSTGEFHGREFKDKLASRATVRTDSAGGFQTSFTVPEGFGFIHDVLVMKEGEVLNKAAFDVKMQASLSPSSGPVGTPITIELEGVGWRPLENSWTVLYDNRFTGWMSSVTTNGLARATIPAVGAPGKHIIQVVHGSMTFPYMNMQQSPRPDRPQWTLEFTVTDGAAVLPQPAQNQSLSVEKETTRAQAGKPALRIDPVSGPLGTPITLEGQGFSAGEQVELLWFTVKGNRVSGGGWGEASTPLGMVRAAENGVIKLSFPALDDLGGSHRIEARSHGEKVAETAFSVTPSAYAVEPASGQVGTPITIHLKGVGWTETANIYSLIYDNAYMGYACGFNSQGDVTVHLPATGEPGWHFIDLYPGIYKGKDMKRVNNFRIPQLTSKDDHPGETLPAFHFAFLVTESSGQF